MMAEPPTPAPHGVPSCLYCGGSASEPLCRDLGDQFGVVAGRWSYWRCGQCGSAALFPMPSRAELASCYPATYGFTLQPRRASGPARWLAGLEYRVFFRPQYRHQVRRVLAGMGLREGSTRRLLDLGCGNGLRTLAFQERGFAVQGMDFRAGDPDGSAAPVPVVDADLSDLPRHVAPGSFDVVTSFHVLEHVPNAREVVRNAFEILKPGGWFAAAVPLAESCQASLFRRRWVGYDAPRHVSVPTRRALALLCRDAGFERIVVRPDSATYCASMAVLSALPWTSTTRRRGVSVAVAPLLSAAAGLLGACWLPLSWLESHVLKRPASGMILAQKPSA